MLTIGASKIPKRRLSKEWKDKISKSMTGKVKNKEIKEKISNSVKKIWEDNDYRNKQIKGMRKKWKDPQFREKQSKIRTKIMIEKWEEPKFKQSFSKRVSQQMKRQWKDPIFKHQQIERLTGKGNPNWNPNREEVYTPYGADFYENKEKIFRELMKEQGGRDALTRDNFKENDLIVRHHINYNKNDNRLENMCLLTNKTHGQVPKKYSTKKELFKIRFQKGKLALREGKPPDHWPEKNKKLFMKEKSKQLDLSKFFFFEWNNE